MTKIEISVADIRKGDLIRYEYLLTPGKAEEWIASFDKDSYFVGGGKHILLDRPEQPFKVGTVLTGIPLGLNLYIRGGDGWYAVPATDKLSDPRKSEFTDDLVRRRVNQGFLTILSEPA